jgi:Arm DNA-binding domain
VLTKQDVKKLHCPSGKSDVLLGCGGQWAGYPCSGVGTPVGMYQYRDEHGRTRRMALGHLTSVDLHAAREAAKQHAASVTQGSSPSAERRAKRGAVTVGDVIKRYLSYAEKKERPRLYVETKRRLQKDAADLRHERVEAAATPATYSTRSNESTDQSLPTARERR